MTFQRDKEQEAALRKTVTKLTTLAAAVESFSWSRNLAHFSRPEGGWIRAVRRCFQMSGQTLAVPLGISRQAISALELSEVEGKITLAKLEQVAASVGCDLRYYFVPNESIPDVWTALEGIPLQVAEVSKAADLLSILRRLALERASLADTRERIATLSDRLAALGAEEQWLLKEMQSDLGK